MAELTKVEVLVVGGGGAGGQDIAGGGGGGGVVYEKEYTVTAGDAITVIVGAGGARPISAQTQGTGGIDTETVALPVVFDKPGIFTYEVKPGTYTVKIWGAGGGGSSESTGAGGACVVQTNIMVSATETWTIYVGEGGSARNYTTNDLELGGIVGYGPGGNGATEQTAFNADFIAAGLINTSLPRNTTDINLNLITGETQPQYWLDNYNYFVYDTKAIYYSRDGANKYSVVLSEKFRKSGNNIVENSESPRATFERGLSFLYLENESVFYRMFKQGIDICLSNSAGTKNLCKIRGSAVPFTLVFVDGSVEITGGGAVINIQDKNKSYPIPDLSTGTLPFTGMVLNTDFKYNGSIANINTSKGSGGGGGAASGISGLSIPGKDLIAGGGGGAGAFKSLLSPATGGGRGTGQGGKTTNNKFGLAGENSGDYNDVPTVRVTDVPDSIFSDFLNLNGIWVTDNNNPFEKSYLLNLKQGSYTFRLSAAKQAAVYIGDTRVIESKIWSQESLPSTWSSYTIDQRIQWFNDNKISQRVLYSLGFTPEEVTAFSKNGTVKYNMNNMHQVGWSIDRPTTVSFNPGQDGFVTLRIIGIPNDFIGFPYNSVALEIFSGSTTVFSTNDVSKYVTVRSVSGGGGGGASCQNALSASDIFPGDWYKKTAQQKIDWYNQNNITQDVLKYYGAWVPELTNLGYNRGETGYAADIKHAAGGGEGGASKFNNMATHFIGENSNSTGEVPKPGNNGDKDYRTGAGVGGPINSKGGAGLVLILNTQSGGGSGQGSSSSSQSANGGNSVFGKLVAIGGGGGAGSASSANAGTGGSGGGTASGRLAGKGTTGQGTDGSSGSSKCYDIDTFVYAKRGSYGFDLYKSRAQNIMPLYTSNSSYSLPDSSVRYGLYRFPDIDGLAYWTKICLEKNYTINTPEFRNEFFTAVAATSEASRAQTSSKSQDTTSESGCGFRDGSLVEVGGGGGGADGPGKTTGEGGNGKRIEITGSAVFYGGGGGGTNIVNSSITGGVGGGGANGGYQASTNNGLPNTGGGGSAYSGEWGGAGNGGSGVVIVKYPSPKRAVGGLTTESGGYVLHRFVNVGSDTLRINKEEIVEPPPPPIEGVELTCEGDIALSEFYAGDSLVRAGTVGYPENIRTPIPQRGQKTIAVKNFYGAKTGEYTIVGVNPDTSANVTLWEQRTQVLFKVTSIKEVERLYWSIESAELNQIFNPQIYPAQTIGNYTNFVNTTAPLVVIGGPYRGRVGLSKTGPIGVFAPDPLITEIQLDEFGNYFGSPQEAFMRTGIYQYTFKFPSSNNYSYTGGNIRVWTANILPAPISGNVAPVIPPVLVAIPPTTTTTTTIRVYNTTINTDPVGTVFNLCAEVNVIISDGIPGAGVSGVIKGPAGSLTDGTGIENLTPFNVPVNGQVSIGKRKFSVPGNYSVTLSFSAPPGRAIQGGSSKTLNFTVRPGTTLQVRSATGQNTFIEKSQVRVVITGGNDDIINWSGPTTGSVNLGPDGSETVTLLESGHTLPARDYEWTFVASNANAKTCNQAKFKIVLNESSVTIDPEPPGPACDTATFNQTGSYEYEGYGPKGMLMYDVGGGKYAAFQNDIGNVRGTTSARYAEKCYGDNTNGYAARSHWGLAAVHSGLVKHNETAIIKVESLGLKKNFRSSSANGVTSSTLTDSECAYKISKITGTPRPNVCAPSLSGVVLTGANGPINSNNEVQVVGNGGSLNNIYGNNTYGYVYFSDISKAVVHAGILDNGETGNIKIYPIGNQSQFPGTYNEIKDVRSLGYDGDSCALKFSKVGSTLTTTLPPGTPGVPTEPDPGGVQCTPIDFTNCCPLVYTAAILNASTLYDTEAKRANIGIPPGENFSSTGVINIIPGGGGGTGTGLTKIATQGIAGKFFGDNTTGYAWGSRLNMALYHSGLVKQSDFNARKFAVKVINLGSKTGFAGSLDPFGVISSSAYTGKACAFKFELVTSGSAGSTTGGPGSTTGGPGSTTGGPGTPSGPSTTTPPTPRITSFSIDQNGTSTVGAPRWSLTYSGADNVKLSLLVVSGRGITDPVTVWSKNIDSRQFNYYAESLKLSTGIGKPIPYSGTQYTFRLVAESTSSGTKDFTYLPGSTRPDGSRRVQDAFWFSSR